MATFLAALAAPVSAQAWGFEAHRYIMDMAIALLPAELTPLYDAYRPMLVERVVDPDTWRTAGFDNEDPHHFLDIDFDGFGPYPFDALPRDYEAAVLKFGVETIRRNGLLPWRVSEYFGKLRRAFEEYARRPNAGTRFDLLFYSAALSHYVGDAHVPFHAVTNYDGQLTNQHGIHARFEAVAFERYRTRLRIQPKPMAPIRTARDFIFDTVIAGTRLVSPILDADLKAIGTKDLYDDEYFDRFFAGVQPVMEQRLSEAISATAAMIAGAWEAAGRPAAPVQPPPAPAPRRRR